MLLLKAELFFSIFSLFNLNYNLTFYKYMIFQNIFDFFILKSYFLLSVSIITYIFISLLKNMFEYSIKYYLLNCILNFQINMFIWKFTFKDYLVSKILSNFFFTKKINLAFKITDTMFLNMLLLLVLIYYNFLLYYNFANVSMTQLTSLFSTNFNICKWISFNQDFIYFGLIIDHLSLLMLTVVLSISTLVHYYSLDYMATDPWLLTFLKYLSGFTLAMLVLITANNYALLFLGWEGVGIFSYLLIGFWYTRTSALKASLKAVIVNWIGDIALIIASALTLQFFGTLEFKKLFFLIIYLFEHKVNEIILNFYFFEISLITLISIFLLIAAIGKSAQFGLHTWLPDAMEGPTPVSALIHAATMVTAGVYLIVWSSFFFEFSEIARNLTLIIGAFTALFGAVTACHQFDIKRIIAFSTCSQLGYMFLACGLSAYNLAMFHLFIHAFFKALLFLCAGSIIHSIGDEQDIWKMGGLVKYLPITYVGLCIGFFSLSGLPFTSGFFSKDTIIELALTKWTIPGAYAYICAITAAWFTGFYTGRFCFYVALQETRLSWNVLSSLGEHGKNILTVIGILTFITIFIGGITKNPLTSPISFIFFNDSIFINNNNFYFNLYETFIIFYETVHDYCFNYLKIILFFIPITGIYIALIFHYYPEHWWMLDWIDEISALDWRMRNNLSYETENWDYWYWNLGFWKLFETKGATDFFYNWFIVKPILWFSYSISYKELDRGWLEFFFIKLPTFICFFFSKIFNQNFSTLKLNFLPAITYISFTIFYIWYLLFVK